MTEKDFSLGVAKPVKGRNVSGFDTPAPEAKSTRVREPQRQPEPPKKTPSSAQTRQPRTPPKASAESTRNASMVRVHTSLSVEAARALKRHAETTRLTQTEILAEALLTHGDALAGESDPEARAQYEAIGFRPPRRIPREGRMSTTFYMSTVARSHLDDRATHAGFDGRSSFIDALIRRQLGLPD